MDHCSINDTSSALLPDRENMDSLGNALRMAAYATSLVFALPINSFVLWLILRGQREKIASDFVPLNQMVGEIIFSLNLLWHVLRTLLSHCFFSVMFVFNTSMFLIARPLAQSYLCMEQYLATVHPLIFLKYKPLRYRLTCGCVSWLVVFILTMVCTVFGFNSEVTFLLTALYVYFMSLMIFCCVSVLRALKRPGPGEGQKDQQKGNRMKRRAFKIILINLVHSALSQVPFTTVLILGEAMTPASYSLIIAINVWTFVLTAYVPALLYLNKVRMLPKRYCF